MEGGQETEAVNSEYLIVGVTVVCLLLVFPSLPAPLRANIATDTTGENQRFATMFFWPSVWESGGNFIF